LDTSPPAYVLLSDRFHGAPTRDHVLRDRPLDLTDFA
jgi:hypothetical protein